MNLPFPPFILGRSLRDIRTFFLVVACGPQGCDLTLTEMDALAKKLYGQAVGRGHLSTSRTALAADGLLSQRDGVWYVARRYHRKVFPPGMLGVPETGTVSRNGNGREEDLTPTPFPLPPGVPETGTLSRNGNPPVSPLPSPHPNQPPFIPPGLPVPEPTDGSKQEEGAAGNQGQGQGLGFGPVLSVEEVLGRMTAAERRTYPTQVRDLLAQAPAADRVQAWPGFVRRILGGGHLGVQAWTRERLHSPGPAMMVAALLIAKDQATGAASLALADSILARFCLDQDNRGGRPAPAQAPAPAPQTRPQAWTVHVAPGDVVDLATAQDFMAERYGPQAPPLDVAFRPAGGGQFEKL